MDLTTIILSTFWFFLGAITSYLTSKHFHKKSEGALLAQNKWLDSQLSQLSMELKSLNGKNKLALYEERMRDGMDEFKKKGTPKSIIDSYSDLSQEEKADMYDQLCIRKKGKPGKSNPYR